MMYLREHNDRLNETFLVCSTHMERMLFALKKIENHFPLTVESYEDLNPEIISFFDQYIFRFSKWQDAVGSKLFKSILDNLGEETRNVAFIDILNELESLNILNNAEEWIQLRIIRNKLSHEYPSDRTEIVEGINLLFNNMRLIENIWEGLREYLFKRFRFLMNTKSC